MFWWNENTILEGKHQRKLACAFVVRDATAMPNEPSLQVRIENGANVADRCVLLPVVHNYFFLDFFQFHTIFSTSRLLTRLAS